MLGMILRRLAQLPLILGVVFLVTLTLAWLVPGNPMERPEGRRPPPEVQRAMLERYKLDNFWSFAGSYLSGASGLRWVTAGGQKPEHVFDLGPSLQYRDRDVNEIIAGALPVSATLGTLAIALAVVVGVPVGVLGAIRPGSWIDWLTLPVALVGVSLPTFVVGTALLVVFAVWLPWLPVGEWGTPRALVLPVLTLSLPFMAFIARLTRAEMIEQLRADYVRTARAKGLGEAGVILRHALPNALLPVVSFLGPATAYAVTGSFVVERVFTVPGLGQHFVNAVQNKDLFLIIGVVLVAAAALIVLNLVVDVLYALIDPRIDPARK